MSTFTGKAIAVSHTCRPILQVVAVVLLLLTASILQPAETRAEINPVHLSSGSNSNSQSVYITGSFTIKPNMLILAFIHSHLPGNPGLPSLSGHGLTWEVVTSVDWKTLDTPDDRLTVLRAVGSSQTTSTVTISFPRNQNNVLWTFMQFERADITPAAIKQYTNSRSENAYSLTLNLAPLQSSANASVGFFAQESEKDNAITFPAGYGVGPLVKGTGPNRVHRVGWMLPGSTTVSASFLENKPSGAIALEVGVGVITTLDNGSDPGPSVLAPGGGATFVDAFTLRTDRETASISDFTVTLSAGSSAAISLIEITDVAGTSLGSLSPSSDTPKVPLNSPLTITTSQSAYKVRITPKSHADMPAPQGTSYNVTARITDWTDYSNHAGADTGSATVTIDNLSPADVTGASAAPGDTDASISWTNPADADLAGVVVLRSTTSPITARPAEGQDYTAGTPVAAGVYLACVATSPATSCTAADLTNTTTYYFKVFSKDTHGNYSANGTATPTPATPQHYQPDVLIKLSGEAEAAFAGGNIYESSAATQAKSQGVPSAHPTTPAPAIYHLRFQNDGSTTDKLVISGTGSGSNFTVRYFDAFEGGNEQTSQVTGGSSYTTAILATGAYADWRVEAIPNGGGTPVAGGASYDVLVTARSFTAGTRLDQVKATTTSTSAKLTLLKSADKSSCKPGEDITYSTSASNGSNLTEARTVVIIDPVPANTGFRIGSPSFNAGTSALSVDSISYSNGAWGYAPVSGGCGAPAGYDYCVTQVRWTLQGTMATGTNCAVTMAVRVK